MNQIKNNASNISVLGAGSWGIALANLCAKNGQKVFLWEFDSKAAQELQINRCREAVLPNTHIHDSIKITDNLQTAIENSELSLLVVPSHVARSVIQKIAKLGYPMDFVLVSCAKGIENGTNMRMSEIVRDELLYLRYGHFAVLSGPSHAEEVARGVPTAVVVASEDENVSQYVQNSLSAQCFRVYRSNDVAGVELGGALKNVIAIAAGICDGAGFGDNTKAALQPRGLAEISRLGRVLNANPLTFAGLSGMGDLIVTCMSKHSRNRFVGEEIGKGQTLDAILNNMTMVAEGVRTSKSVVALAEKYSVEMPICTEVFKVLFEGKEAKAAMEDLMGREIKPEVWY